MGKGAGGLSGLRGVFDLGAAYFVMDRSSYLATLRNTEPTSTFIVYICCKVLTDCSGS